DIFEGTDLADMLGNSQQQSQSPPEKRPRTGSARTSRIYEMSSNASSSAEPASQGSPPNGASGRQSAQRIGSSNTTTVRRKVPSPQSTALTRTQNRPLIAGAQLPSVFSNAASSSALVPLAGPSLSTISSRTKSIEQLQQEIDSLGVSLDHLTRQLHSGANRDATPDPLLSSFGGSAASAPTMTASAADMMLQSLSTSKADINSLLTPEALNDLAVALTAPNTTLSSHGLDSTVSGGLSRTSMAHLSGYRGNPPTAAPIFDPSAAAISAYNGHGAPNSSNTFEPNWLLQMLQTCTPEQYESLQNYFKLISPSSSSSSSNLNSSAAPVRAAMDNGVGGNDSPIANTSLTPFLDFDASGNGLTGFDTNGTSFFAADDISTSDATIEPYSHGGLGPVAGSVDDYAQIFLDALNGDPVGT
ncbi:hypothetical protein GGI00_006200, partial [Coemansia sp. RSA 2681]